jgi:predicted ATPase
MTFPELLIQVRELLQSKSRVSYRALKLHKQQEAHELLSKIYNWFTEGFDTKDLQEAKTLIEELSH